MILVCIIMFCIKTLGSAYHLRILFPFLFISNAFYLPSSIALLMETAGTSNILLVTSLHLCFTSLASFVFAVIGHILLTHGLVSLIFLIPVIAIGVAVVLLALARPIYEFREEYLIINWMLWESINTVSCIFSKQLSPLTASCFSSNWLCFYNFYAAMCRICCIYFFADWI